MLFQVFSFLGFLVLVFAGYFLADSLLMICMNQVPSLSFLMPIASVIFTIFYWSWFVLLCFNNLDWKDAIASNRRLMRVLCSPRKLMFCLKKNIVGISVLSFLVIGFILLLVFSNEPEVSKTCLTHGFLPTHIINTIIYGCQLSPLTQRDVRGHAY